MVVDTRVRADTKELGRLVRRQLRIPPIQHALSQRPSCELKQDCRRVCTNTNTPCVDSGRKLPSMCPKTLDRSFGTHRGVAPAAGVHLTNR
jgi:hypothetical protein